MWLAMSSVHIIICVDDVDEQLMTIAKISICSDGLIDNMIKDRPEPLILLWSHS